MTWEIEKIDHIGGRKEQQDSIATFSNGDTHLIVIADGMGGHKGGRFASKVVIESAQQEWDKQSETMPKKLLQNICERAHRNINELGKKRHLSPRSTCVLLYIKNNQAWWTYLGDSRLYHFRRQKLLQRTIDHSIVQLLVDTGRIKEEEMATHPDQGRLLKGLGGEEPIKLDFSHALVRPGDTFVLCSDGFWEQVSSSHMLKRLQTNVPLKTQIQQLLADALDAGGIEGDNIAVAVAHLKKSQKNIKTYILLSLIIIATLCGGVWYYLKL